MKSYDRCLSTNDHDREDSICRNIKGNLGTDFEYRALSYIVQTIRMFNGCMVLIENSVTRVTVLHHEACRVMPNRYPSDGIFSLHRITIMDSFSCILFLRQLHLDLNTCCFVNLR